MTQPPVLFFAYANEEQRFLKYLKEESTSINQALLPVEAKGFIRLVREESTELTDLFQVFQTYKDRIAVFHFAGHAEGQQLKLEDRTAEMQQLAQLIAEQKDTLRLVFLNGCATAGQVEYLHQLGISVVIATHCSVADTQAKIFAARFYAALANHFTLQGAFKHAKTYLEMKHEKSLSVFRGIVFRYNTGDSIPWGMYISPTAEPDILDWKLPQYYAAPRPASLQVSYTINKNMLRLLEALKEKAPHLDQRQYPTEEALIITSFPWIISVHLFRLFADAESMTVAGLPRLRELIQAYVATTRFLSYIAVAQLWNELKSGQLTLERELEEFFLLNQSDNSAFDYMSLLQKVCQHLKGKEIDWFMPELTTIAERWSPRSEMFDQYRFVESTRWRLSSSEISPEEIEEGCYLCESVLTDLLTQAAGLVNFSLLTVRDIRIINPAHIATATPFEHMIGDLHVPFQTYLKHRPRSLEQYINSHSVLLTHRSEEQRINRYLNLSPFFLDKTAFGDGKGKNTPVIYALHHWEADNFVFQNVNYNVNQKVVSDPQNSIDFLVVRPEMDDYQIVLEQMHSLIKDMQA